VLSHAPKPTDGVNKPTWTGWWVTGLASYLTMLLRTVERVAYTALHDIKQLLDYGILKQNESGGRSTSYKLISDINV